MKPRRFFFHFNKPESLRKKKVLWSVHWDRACYIVEKIECKVACESKSNKRQPYAVIRGWANNVNIEGGIATINLIALDNKENVVDYPHELLPKS